MPRVRFTQNIQRHVPCPTLSLTGPGTVRAALDAYFVRHPNARSYVLDDQGSLRKHMAIFIDGEPLQDRQHLTDPVGPESDIDVLQALSGG